MKEGSTSSKDKDHIPVSGVPGVGIFFTIICVLLLIPLGILLAKFADRTKSLKGSPPGYVGQPKTVVARQEVPTGPIHLAHNESTQIHLMPGETSRLVVNEAGGNTYVHIYSGDPVVIPEGYETFRLKDRPPILGSQKTFRLKVKALRLKAPEDGVPVEVEIRGATD